MLIGDGTQSHPLGDDCGIDARQCDWCTLWYHPLFPSADLCYYCWKESSGDTVTRPEYVLAAMDGKAPQAKPQRCAECASLAAMKAKLCELEQTVSALTAELNSRKMIKTPQPASLGEMLPRLIQLCHPDKHANSQAANDATAWLLAQRKQSNKF